MKLIAYHSNLYFREFKSHVAEIKEKGFDTILFCITETDLKFNMKIFDDFRQYSESEGLECWATFWGLSAGEAICTDCDLLDWIEKIKSIGFTDIMIDEPKDLKVFKKLKGIDIGINVCFSDSLFNSLTVEQIKSLPAKRIGLSCYHLGHNSWIKVTERTKAWCEKLLRITDNNFVFLQGFDINSGMEALPTVVKSIAEEIGIKDFAFWSFRATEATGAKRPVNYEAIWKQLKF